MNRRSFFATLLAPFLKRFRPELMPWWWRNSSSARLFALKARSIGRTTMMADYLYYRCAVGTGYWTRLNGLQEAADYVPMQYLIVSRDGVDEILDLARR